MKYLNKKNKQPARGHYTRAKDYKMETNKDYEKLKKQFEEYQIAMQNEIKDRIKQTKIEVLNELKKRLIVDYQSVVTEIYQLIEEN